MTFKLNIKRKKDFFHHVTEPYSLEVSISLLIQTFFFRAWLYVVAYGLVFVVMSKYSFYEEDSLMLR